MEGSEWLWIWIGAAVVLAFLELAAPGTFFLVSFAVGAGAAAMTAAVGGGLVAQWGCFVVVSAAALVMLVPLGRRLARHETDEAHEGATRWIGRVGVVLEEIPRAPHATGRVRVERDEWRAETEVDAPIGVGTEVEVLAVRGTRLVVAPAQAHHQGGDPWPQSSR